MLKIVGVQLLTARGTVWSDYWHNDPFILEGDLSRLSAIGWIDEAEVKADVDKFVPILEALVSVIPVVGTKINTGLTFLKAIADNDSIRVPVVALINSITGAQPPAVSA